ncbi:MAG TPA: hypothetical protein VLI67_00030 [Vicinamibacteria bacterium]|nr:hypothetical protein [Vicinamibacteria bacterium]
MAADLRARPAGRLPLALETAEAAPLEAYFAAGSLGFPTRVFDLGMMGYTLRGGRLHRAAGRPSALSVYLETATGKGASPPAST